MGLDKQALERAIASWSPEDLFGSTLCGYGLESGFSLHIFPDLVSTNQSLWNLIEAGATEGTVVLARRQSGGRGQWGRQWRSPEGGLYLSLALKPDLPISQAQILTLCSAWGIATVLRDRNIPVAIKWPNDLVLDRRKLGGILTETRLDGDRIHTAVVGVGINWTNPVPDHGINLHSFLSKKALPGVASLEQLAALTLQGMTYGYRYFRRYGIEHLLPSYLKLLTHLGRQAIVEGRPGIITGVSPTGQLQVTLSSTASPSEDRSRDRNPSEILLQPGTINLGYENL
ncbi:biotin--[acetyl-CoA-carboxylase] ligase [Oxynema aestuarii]|uniref:Biotin--[acetyl-CoA-carboxylase] ligase n=1 Tax=Oxynema aestuarii AP17 TaxID=2064643 RepID=A0A6H1TZ89_9CYAN|nr:biotin--[acetyl-CoA-carboxylase] ligase [Oxynema aestuarii]QIZ71904.1 biotin--[acetyl-CoA-carboxylase] ligase [Oxynema aestuarii AP17]RMH77033.1 MAG: biotin--[acetyl-CoA-carboxylase] ligase [Cyanobacteria bacterium J007]